MQQHAVEWFRSTKRQALRLLPYLPLLTIALACLIFVLRLEAGLCRITEELEGVRTEVASVGLEVGKVRIELVQGLADQKVQTAREYAQKQDLAELGRRVLELERFRPSGPPARGTP